MKFKAKKRVILSDFEPFLTLKFAKKMFSRAILPYRAVAKMTFHFFCNLFNKQKSRSERMRFTTTSSVPATTYFPGQLPAKYHQHCRA